MHTGLTVDYIELYFNSPQLVHIRQCPFEEVCCTHPGFDRAESMLNRLPSRSHGIRSLIQSGLHRIQNVFMLPARHLAMWAWRALLLEAAVLAIVRPVAMLR